MSHESHAHVRATAHHRHDMYQIIKPLKHASKCHDDVSLVVGSAPLLSRPDVVC